MSDFIEQVPSTTSQPELSQDTPTVSANLPGIEDIMAGKVILSDPETTKATLAALAPWLPEDPIYFTQDKDEDAELHTN